MGERQPLVLVCGIGEDAALWQPVMALLADCADCLAMVADGDTIAAMADDVLTRVPGQFAIAGHSLGGYVALAVQRAAPHRITGLALINSSARADTQSAMDGRRRMIDRIGRDGFAALVRSMVPRLAGSPAFGMIAEAMLIRTGPARFVRDQRAAMTRPDARSDLPTIAIPVLALASAADEIVPPELSDEIGVLAPGATSVTLPGIGHLSPIEAPSTVAEALRTWLAAAIAPSDLAIRSTGRRFAPAATG